MESIHGFIWLGHGGCMPLCLSSKKSERERVGLEASFWDAVPEQFGHICQAKSKRQLQSAVAISSFATTGNLTLLTQARRAAADCFPAYRPMVMPRAAASLSCPTTSQIVH